MDYNLLLLLVFNCLYIFGFYSATDYGLTVDNEVDPDDRELLWWVKWGLRNAPNYIQKPIFGCVVCMSSVHSWMYWIFTPELTLHNLVTYIIYIFALSGLNAIVNDRLSD